MHYCLAATGCESCKPTEEALLGAIFDVKNPMEVGAAARSRRRTGPDRLRVTPSAAGCFFGGSTKRAGNTWRDSAAGPGGNSLLPGGPALPAASAAGGSSTEGSSGADQDGPRRGTKPMEGTGSWLPATAASCNGLVSGATPWSRASLEATLAGAFGNGCHRRRHPLGGCQRQEGNGRSDAVRLLARETL